MSQKFSYVRILTDKYTKSFEFYNNILGLDLKLGGIEDDYCEFETGNTDIALFKRDSMNEQTDLHLEEVGPLQSNVMIIIQVDDVDAMYEFLQEVNANIISEPTTREDWDVRNFHLRDPSGNLIEINSRLDQ